MPPHSYSLVDSDSRSSMRNTEITLILRRLSDGDRSALDELIPAVYEQMKGIALNANRQEAVEYHSPTELVHEAYLRLLGSEKLQWQSRSHFFGACATVIRRILVDQARKRNADKREGQRTKIGLDANLAENQQIDLLDLELALEKLATLAPRQVKLVELRYFGGLTEAEAAEVLGVSRRTVAGDWSMAKAWLRSQLDT